MLMYLIGKLSKDHKVDWPKHLQELEHAYNSMSLAIHQLQPTLFDVHVLTNCAYHCDLLLPYDEGHRETPMC